MNMTSLTQSQPRRKPSTSFILLLGVVLASWLAFAPPASVSQELLPATVVPVGAVIDWWRPNDTFPLPEGFQMCDGSLVTDPMSPLLGMRLPDLRNRFVRGVDNIGFIGDEGGAESHDHIVDLPAHTHTGTTALAGGHMHTGTTAPAGGHTHTSTMGMAGGHTHNDTTVDPPLVGMTRPAGIHNHTWAKTDGSSWTSGDGQFIGDFEAFDFDPDCLDDCAAFPYYPLVADAADFKTSFGGTHRHTIEPAGNHTHALTINSVANHAHTFTTAAVADHNHPVSISPQDPAPVMTDPVDHLPPYVDLLKIMRIR